MKRMAAGSCRRTGVVLVSLALALGAALACSDTADDRARLAQLSQPCSLNSDCRDPLSCSFGRCHVQCKESRDCSPGLRCVQVEGGGVCQLPDEVNCPSGGECPGKQVCASDLECRDPCAGAPCLKDQVCVEDTCADPSELVNGQLPKPDGGGGSGGSGGSGAAGGSGGGTGGSSGTGGLASDAGADAGCAADLQLDPKNCGRCGRECGLGSGCNAGLCAGVALHTFGADGGAATVIRSAAVAASKLVVVEKPSGGTTFTSWLVDKNGGASQFDVLNSSVTPIAAVSGGDALFSHDKGFWKKAVSGGAGASLYSIDPQKPVAMALSGGWLFWEETVLGTEQVLRRSLDGTSGSSTALAAGSALSLLCADAGHVYVVTDQGAIQRHPLNGGVPSGILTGSSSATDADLAVSDGVDFVWYNRINAIKAPLYRVSLPKASPVPLLADIRISSLLLDGQDLYFHRQFPSPTGLYVMPKTGGIPTRLADVDTNHVLFGLDAQYLYYYSTAAPRTVYKVAR